MSVETTNTPNGGSNDWYSINGDVGEIIVAITDMSQKDPNRDLTGNVVGDNTVTETSIIIDNTGAIRDAGCVSIRVIKVGEPMIVSPESSNAIKASIQEIKNEIIARGAVNANDYIKGKKNRSLGKSKEEPEAEEHDKDNDGIDDRNQ